MRVDDDNDLSLEGCESGAHLLHGLTGQDYFVLIFPRSRDQVTGMRGNAGIDQCHEKLLPAARIQNNMGDLSMGRPVIRLYRN
jgi:hypothetical protein